jgi:hypothetical protein
MEATTISANCGGPNVIRFKDLLERRPEEYSAVLKFHD